MRITAMTCQRRKCSNFIRVGFRFCGLKTCGKKIGEEE
tara:strand:- start:190 stop:303 length:114 start_codon:yes stop_codon:yes gene_type:complete